RAPQPEVRRPQTGQKDTRMEATELFRGRLIDHLQLVVRDLDASRRFYEPVLATLGIPLGGSGDTWFWADELFVSSIDSEAAQGAPTGRHHFAFQARDRAMVEAFHAAALANGGRDNGAPGERPYHPGSRRLRAGSGRQQHRGGLPRPRAPQRRRGTDQLRRLSPQVRAA